MLLAVDVDVCRSSITPVARNHRALGFFGPMGFLRQAPPGCLFEDAWVHVVPLLPDGPWLPLPSHVYYPAELGGKCHAWLEPQSVHAQHNWHYGRATGFSPTKPSQCHAVACPTPSWESLSLTMYCKNCTNTITYTIAVRER